MLRNYFLVLLRTFRKSKIFTFVNILGLAVGMTAALLILHYVTFERSYDKFHADAERIYRVRYERTSEDGSAARFASCAPPAGAHIRGQFPVLENIGRIFRYNATMSYGDKKYFEDRMYYAEPEIFEILKFNFLEGDPVKSLAEPNFAFISKSTAKKYFGDENPVGKILSYDKSVDYEVAGIFEDVPANSHLKFDILLSFQNIVDRYGDEVMEAWGHTGFYTYAKLKPGADPQVFKQNLADIIEAEIGEALAQYNMKMELPLQPITDIHLNSNFMQEYEVNGSRETVNLLLTIALFIIVIAWVNYINLSTARSLNRAGEVGLRKVAGASRRQLITQFFFETAAINLAAILLAFGLMELFLPFFSGITGTPVQYSFWGQSWFWEAAAGIFFLGIFAAGLYPVMVMSSFAPITILRGKIGNTVRGVSLRKILVVFQFVMSLALITGTLAVYQQIKFMRSQDLGFDIDQVLVVKAPRVRGDDFKVKLQTFKETLLNKPAIRNISFVTEVPGRQIYWDAGGIMKEGENISKSKNYQIMGIDYDFMEVFNIEVLEGRNFSAEFPADDKALIMNETAVRWMGFENPRDAVGSKASYWGESFEIVGVLADYHQQSLKTEFEPTLFRYMPEGRGRLGAFAFKLNTIDVRSQITSIEQQFHGFFPGNPFEYFFLDEYFDRQYQADELLGRVSGIFAFLAIFVTGLGIFGLSSFLAVQRTKEIGIRKVLGASVPRILILLNRDFLIMMVVSFLLALPLTYWGVNKWLQTYAARMEAGVLLFILPAIMVLIVTLLTINSHSLKTAKMNPVESLRYE